MKLKPVPLFFKALRKPGEDPADLAEDKGPPRPVDDDPDAADNPALPAGGGDDVDGADAAAGADPDPDSADALQGLGDAPGDASVAGNGSPVAKNAPSDPKTATPDAANGNPDAADPAAGAEAKPPKNPPMEYFTELLKIIADRQNPDGTFGPDIVKEGHHVAFSAGDFAGAGKVHAVGRDGVTVHDSSQRAHNVHWREITGHFAGEDDESDADAAAAAAKPAKGKK